MATVAEQQRTEIRYTAPGFGVEPCPGCRKIPEPNEPRVVVPGVWRPWHATCYDEAMELL